MRFAWNGHAGAVCGCSCGAIGKALRTALLWWCEVLKYEICEERPWTMPRSSPLHLWVDARSTPPRCAAVLYADGHWKYTDGKPSKRIMSRFGQRADKQITSLEMVALALGLSTFADSLRGRKVVLYTDNKGAEACSEC